jgi:hypothetical protein
VHGFLKAEMAVTPSLQNVRCRALYDYQARNENELSFKKGQIIFLFQADDDGWASGECHGVTGECDNQLLRPLLFFFFTFPSKN